jgi:ubiquinone/menaquinone biosynthesis C-methylase UbiE
MAGDTEIGHAFKDPDASGSSEALAAYLDNVAIVLSAQKRASIDAMALAPGDAGLDVGCGAGDEVRLIAERVGPSGRAVGVDVSEDLLVTARERTPEGVGAEFVAADAHALPFADDEFAAARVERALQHMSDPGRAVAEIARVVRRGGRVVAGDPDWETLVVSSRDPETTRVVLDEYRATIRNPAVGRAIAGYFIDAGIAIESMEAVAMAIPDGTAATLFFPLQGAVERVGTEAARSWLDDLHEQTARGAFCAALTGFVIVGTVAGA